MLRLGWKQMESLSHASHARFEARMLIHLRRFFPEHCLALGDEGTRELIRLGIQQAASHQLIVERDVCKFINLMMALGRDFDREMAWARDLFQEETLPPPERLSRVYQAATEREQARG